MAKTDLTLKLEEEIHSKTNTKGMKSEFGLFEVTIGFNDGRPGYERIDYLTYDTKGIWRAFEIKVSLSDFRSSAKKSFVGHYNYYVLTKELYELVKDEIPSHIGVYIGSNCVKRAKRQELAVDENVLKEAFMRAGARDADKMYRSNSPMQLMDAERKMKKFEKQKQIAHQELRVLEHKLRKRFGIKWEDELDKEVSL
ncbi:hypothetical protein RE735_07745 [Bacillus aerius]|uniref:hypothetical protein n=1 Tax=Bacillus aerius TaxID=293388 RepID=UPI0028151DEA|nr:hypothetical protein [Bacillus aerius]WMT29983.1 hypothetical protein RE735_05330 [Bacillus aerius]WMT30412.1 hypothetical protein RE735_07745 [Bacillus aerius]